MRVLRRVRERTWSPPDPVELNQEQEAAFRGLDRFCLGGGGRRPAVRRHRQRKDPNLYPPDPGGAGQGQTAMVLVRRSP